LRSISKSKELNLTNRYSKRIALVRLLKRLAKIFVMIILIGIIWHTINA